MSTRPGQQKHIPPYLPYKTFSTYLISMKTGGIPGRIDRSLMPSLSGGIQTWLLSALRFFALTDEAGHPTEGLKQLINADDEARRPLLRKLLETCYPSLFQEGFDLKTATNAQLRERFRQFELASGTVDRCITFFIAASRDAGIELSAYLKKPKVARQPTGQNKAKKRAGEKRDGETPEIAEPPFSSDMKRIPIAISTEKTWYIEIENQRTEGEVKNFLTIVRLVLGAES